MQRDDQFFNYSRRLRAAAWVHHGGKLIADVARDFRVNCGQIGEATREFPKGHHTLHVYQQMIGGC